MVLEKRIIGRIDVPSCPRCGMDHKKIHVFAFTRPPDQFKTPEGHTYYGFGICPTNTEPLLLPAMVNLPASYEGNCFKDELGHFVLIDSIDEEAISNRKKVYVVIDPPIPEDSYSI